MHWVKASRCFIGLHIDFRYATQLLFFDMSTDHAGDRPGLAIRLFDITMTMLTLALMAASIAALPLVVLFLTGRGPITVPAELEHPYRISFLDLRDRSIVVASDSAINEYRNFESGEEARYLKKPPDVRVDVRVDRTDTDSRGVIAAYAVVLLLLAWTAVWNLRHIVRSAMDGDPFVPANVTRLRRLATVAFVLPLLEVVATAIVARTLETDPPVDVIAPGRRSWTLIVVGLAVLALAEVFRSGSDLRQFERETV